MKLATTVRIDGVDVTAETVPHLAHGTNPMPPEGWRSLFPACCDECAATAAAERRLRSYYGPLFGEVKD